MLLAPSSHWPRSDHLLVVQSRVDGSAWRETLAACRDLTELGVKNKDIGLMTERLHGSLLLAREEFGSPVHGIEPLSEIDTPGWHETARISGSRMGTAVPS